MKACAQVQVLQETEEEADSILQADGLAVNLKRASFSRPEYTENKMKFEIPKLRYVRFTWENPNETEPKIFR